MEEISEYMTCSSYNEYIPLPLQNKDNDSDLQPDGSVPLDESPNGTKLGRNKLEMIRDRHFDIEGNSLCVPQNHDEVCLH